MKYRRLAKTDIDVSVVCFGCWGIIGGFNWGAQDEDDSLQALRAAFEMGINFYDTAEGYGNGQSEQLLARGLGHKRNEIIIASKVSPNHFAPADLRAAVEESLRNLHTDRIDLYQLHWPSRDIAMSETFAALDALKAEGKIRAYGVSNFGAEDLADALKCSRNIASNQLAYSLLFRAIEHDVLPICIKNDVSVLTYSSLMQGLLSGKYASADDVQPDRARTRHFAGSRPHARHGEVGAEAETFAAVDALRSIATDLGLPMADMALAWLIGQPGVTSVIAGARNVQQARSIAAASEVAMPPGANERLSSATAALRARLGTNPDMWQSKSRIR